MLGIHEFLSLALFYTCFCRAVKTDRRVKKDVLLAFWIQGCVACVSMFAPLAWGWRPDWITVSLLAAVVLLQVVNSAHWQQGIPQEFLKRF